MPSAFALEPAATVDPRDLEPRSPDLAAEPSSADAGLASDTSDEADDGPLADATTRLGDEAGDIEDAADVELEARAPVATSDPLQSRLISGELAVLAVIGAIMLVAAWVALEFAGIVTEPPDPSPPPMATLSGNASATPGPSTGSASALPFPSSTPTPSPISPTPTPVQSAPVIALAAGDAIEGRWRQIADPPIGGRSNAAAAWTGDEMLVWGGFNGEARWGDGGAYNPDADTWRRLPKSPMAARMGPAAAWTGEELLVWGGYRVRFADDGAAYNPTTNRWRELPPAPLEPGPPTGAWTGSRFVVVTGTPSAAFYDPEANAWEALEPPPLDPGVLTVVIAGDRIFVVRHGNDAGEPRSVAELVAADRTWVRLDDGPPAGDGAPSSVVAAGLLLIVGDAIFDIEGRRWSLLDLSSCRFQPSVATAATDALVLSPADAIDLAATTCRPMPRSPNRPDGGPRLGPISVWTGRDWIVWSGGSGAASGTYARDGVAFRPTNP